MIDIDNEPLIGSIDEHQHKNGDRSFRARFSYRGNRFSISFPTRENTEDFLLWVSLVTKYESPTVKFLTREVNRFRGDFFPGFMIFD